MKRKDWFIVIGVLVGLCAFAQILYFIMGPDGALGQKALNRGGQNLALYRVLAMSSFLGIFFLYIFFLLNFILIKRVMGFRLSLAVFTAGMMGDSLDILFQGAGAAELFRLSHISFGLSDVYVVVGLILTLFFVVKDYSVIFQKDNLRKKILIEKEQYSFCFYVILPYFLFVVGFYMFFHVFIQMVLGSAPRLSMSTQSYIINTFLTLFSVLSLCFLLTLAIFVFYFSNKVYGPVYAFKKYINEVLKGKADRLFKLRSGDHFQDLVPLASELKQKIKKNDSTKQE